MSREKIILVLKIVSAVAAAVLAVLGASAMTSCTVNHALSSQGRAVIVTTDTTVVNHTGTFKTK